MAPHAHGLGLCPMRERCSTVAGVAVTRLRVDELMYAWFADRDTPMQMGLLGLFDGRQVAEVDVLEPAREAGERSGVLIDRVSAEIFDVVVVRVYAVKRRARGVNFVEIGEIVVDEMMKRLGRTHHVGSSSNPCSVLADTDKPQWYNILFPAWLAACTSFPPQLETWTTLQCAPFTL